MAPSIDAPCFGLGKSNCEVGGSFGQLLPPIRRAAGPVIQELMVNDREIYLEKADSPLRREMNRDDRGDTDRMFFCFFFFAGGGGGGSFAIW